MYPGYIHIFIFQYTVLRLSTPALQSLALLICTLARGYTSADTVYIDNVSLITTKVLSIKYVNKGVGHFTLDNSGS